MSMILSASHDAKQQCDGRCKAFMYHEGWLKHIDVLENWHLHNVDAQHPFGLQDTVALMQHPIRFSSTLHLKNPVDLSVNGAARGSSTRHVDIKSKNTTVMLAIHWLYDQAVTPVQALRYLPSRGEFLRIQPRLLKWKWLFLVLFLPFLINVCGLHQQPSTKSKHKHQQLHN